MATITVSTPTNLSALTYADSDTIDLKAGAVLTCNATNTVLPGNVQSTVNGTIRLENTSTTAPIRISLKSMIHDIITTGNSFLIGRGQPLDLGTSTGAYMSWDLSTLFGGVLTDITYIEVETAAGSGEYREWPILEVDPRYWHIGRIDGGASKSIIAPSGEVGNVFFYNNATRTLETGDGVGGNLISAGRKIRTVNILVTNDLALDSSLYHKIVSNGTPTGGTFTITITNRKTAVVIGTTTALTATDTVTNVQAAVSAVLGAGNVTSSGGPLPTAITLTLAGTYANTPLAFTVNSSVTGGTNPIIYSLESAPGNMSLINFGNGGTFDCENVMFSRKMYTNVAAFSSFRAVRCGFGGGLYLNNTAGAVSATNVLAGITAYYAAQTDGIFSTLGAATLKNVTYAAKNTDYITYLYGELALSSLDGLKTYRYGVRSTASYASYATVFFNLIIKNLASIGNKQLFYNATGCTLFNPVFADSVQNTQLTTVANNSFALSNSADIVISGASLSGTAAARNAIFNVDSLCKNISILASTIECNNNSNGLALLNNAITTIKNVTLKNVRSGPLLDQSAQYLATNITAQKLIATYATAQTDGGGFKVGTGAIFDIVSTGIRSIYKTFSAVQNYTGGNFADPGLTPTTGHITFGPIGDGIGCTMSGGAYPSKTGLIYLPFNGSAVELELPFGAHAVTALQAAAPVIYADVPGCLANVWFVGNLGTPTGGTFALTITNAAGTVLGTTAAIAYNATSTVVSSAITAVSGASTASVSGTAIGTGYTITFVGALANAMLTVAVDGSLLTGGSDPGRAYAVGRMRQVLSGEAFGSSGVTLQFAVKPYADIWGPWQAATAANLGAAISALAGYAPYTDGLGIKIRLVSTQDNPYSYVNSVGFLTNINPSGWTVSDSYITINGTLPTDQVEITRASDNVVLYTLTGFGKKDLDVVLNYDTTVYFTRKDASGMVLMRTLPATQKLTYGNNGVVNLFYGAQVQLANASDVAAIAARLPAGGKVIAAAGTTALTLDQIVTSGGSGGGTVDLTPVLNRLPAALVGGKMDVHVNDIAAGAITATSIASNALDGKGNWNIGKTGYNVSSIDAGVINATSAPALDVNVSTRMATFTYTAPNNAAILLIKDKTDQLAFTGSNVNAVAWAVTDKTGYTLATPFPTVPNAASISAAVWSETTRSLTDKDGFGLSATERDLLAAVIESHLLNEGDGQMLVNAIVTAIGNQNIDQIALVAAIRADLERTGGKLINLDDTISNVMTALNLRPTLTAIEGSSVLAKVTDISGIPAAIFNFVVENGKTFAQITRTSWAVLKGKTTGAGTTTNVFLSDDGTKPRITTTFDASKNRTDVTQDGD